MKKIFWSLATSLAASVALTTSSFAATTYSQTKYPIVLAHGAGGFNNLAGIDYWYGITKDLRANGATVYVTQVSALNTSELRGAQLLAQVEDILAITGAKKVNLIGHSHGDQSVRYVAGVRPEIVASSTSVAAPAKGSPVADAIQGLTTKLGPTITKSIVNIVNSLGKAIEFFAGAKLPQDSYGLLQSLTTPGAAAFNAKFPAGIPTTACGEGDAVANGVRYYSWGGVGHIYNVFDPVDYLLSVSGLAFQGVANDGLVGKCGNHVGKVIRDDYAMNHFHMVNQILGLVGRGADPVGLFRVHANRLKMAGL